MAKVILASTSHWRRTLFEKLSIPFTTETSNYEEDLTLPLPPEKLVQHLALGKAQAVAKRHRNAIVIGADTIAVFGKDILGKSKTDARAKQVLRKLSGKKNTAITGIAIVDAKTGKQVTRVERTDVYFRKLTEHEIDAYVKTGEPQEGGGGYTIQGAGASLIRRIEGDFYTVVGLPLSALVEELRKFGIGH
jgi:septum formation protein